MPTWEQQDQEELSKIAHADAGGLDATADSLTYQVGEVERHFHSYERWFGLAASVNLPTHAADRYGVGISPFSIDAGNNSYSAWLQILGSADMPGISGNVEFDPHRVLITGIEKNAPHLIQIGYGATGQAALDNDTYTEFPIMPTGAGGQADSGPIEFQSRRQAVGTLVWARIVAPGEDTSVVTFLLGIHEYEG